MGVVPEKYPERLTRVREIPRKAGTARNAGVREMLTFVGVMPEKYPERLTRGREIPRKAGTVRNTGVREIPAARDHRMSSLSKACHRNTRVPWGY